MTKQQKPAPKKSSHPWRVFVPISAQTKAREIPKSARMGLNAR